MDLKKNVLVEYYAGAECETIVVRLSGGESKLFGSCDEFVEFLRSARTPANPLPDVNELIGDSQARK